jgi:hypothetical protein
VPAEFLVEPGRAAPPAQATPVVSSPPLQPSNAPQSPAPPPPRPQPSASPAPRQ